MRPLFLSTPYYICLLFLSVLLPLYGCVFLPAGGGQRPLLLHGRLAVCVSIVVVRSLIHKAGPLLCFIRERSPHCGQGSAASGRIAHTATPYYNMLRIFLQEGISPCIPLFFVTESIFGLALCRAVFILPQPEGLRKGGGCPRTRADFLSFVDKYRGKCYIQEDQLPRIDPA